jgi:hypothetical protein
MKTHGGVKVELHIFLTLALDGGEWSASCPSHFTPRETAPAILWIRGWVGARVNLDAVVIKVKLSLCFFFK